MEILTEDKICRSARVMFGPHPVPTWVLKQIFEKLPKDSVMYRHIEDASTGQFGWVVASEKFKKLEEGEELPKIVANIDSIEEAVDLTFESSFESMLEDL